MARIETDPNYTAPTFSRATAATDLFKKEDVQALAAAMSTHNHDGAGKGLVLANGVITSAMIADGTIDTADLKDGAVTSAKILEGTIVAGDLAAGAVYHQLGNTPSGIPDGSAGGGIGGSGQSTTSTTYVDIPGTTMTLACAGAPARILLIFTIGMYGSLGSGAADLIMLCDGNKITEWRVQGGVTASSSWGLTGSLISWCMPSAGNHTFKMQWKTVSAGGTQMDFVSPGQFWATEFRR